jgi:hypothetical protein
MDNMNKEICDYYEPLKKNYADKMCKYFTGDRDEQNEIDRCRHHCSIMESKRLMEEGQVFRRVKGALRKK